VGGDLLGHYGTLAAPADHDPVMRVKEKQVHKTGKRTPSSSRAVKKRGRSSVKRA
jgi:hypothetical protein